MNKLLLSVILATILFVNITTEVYSENVCEVKDPTGTPLNVRSAPQGKIIGTLPNKHSVSIIDVKKDKKGNEWALVGGYFKGKHQEIGWVFMNYIDCVAPGEEIYNAPCRVTLHSEAPLKVRLSPNGNLVTTLTNGTTVYIDEIQSKSGIKWAKISIKQGDEFITLGWVDNYYLKCDLSGR